MLKSLYDYAIRHDLTQPPGIVNKTVKAYVSLSSTSDYIGVTLGDDAPMPCPDIGSLANGTEKSNVIVEKRSVVIPGTPSIKSAFFLDALKSAAEHDQSLLPCVRALEDRQTRQTLQKQLDAAKIKPSDRISFEIDGRPIVEHDALLDWWQEYRKQFLKEDPAEQTLCLITGEPTIPLATTPSIRGLRAVGGHASGDALICFDKASFGSYGLKQGANAPVSETAYAAVKAALDHLLTDSPILAGMKFVHWYDADIQPQEDPVLARIDFGDFGDLGPEEEPDSIEQLQVEFAANRAATRLVESVRSGERDVELGKTRYHILLLSGVGGRVMIRRYEQGSYEELKQCLDQWDRDLALTNLSGTQLLPSCKLTARLLGLLKVQKADRRPFERLGKELSGVTPSILQGILKGTPMPDSVAVRSLQAIRSHMLSDEEPKRKNYHLGQACQWLKVWLIRNQKKGEIIMSGYNEHNTSAAYQCGAILAIYERIQERAYPNVNVSVVQRYYSSAIQTPAQVIGRLSQLSIHHLRELEKSGKGLRVYFTKLLSDAYAKIDGPIPTVLTLPEQAEFALGYYQMIAKLNPKKEEQ